MLRTRGRAPLVVAMVLAPLVAAIGSGLTAPGAQDSDTTTAVISTTVVPMTTSGAVLRDHTVVVRGDRIVDVGPATTVQVPAGARIIDGRGKHLLPGLVDFHVHLRDARELDEYLRHGVTTVVSMRATDTTLELRDRVRAGAIAGPRILTAGPLVDGAPPIWSGAGTTVVTTEAEAIAAAGAHCRAGYDLLKTYNNLHAALLPALVSRAHACGIPVAAHLPRLPVREEGLARGLAAGIDLIAHAEEIFFTHLGGASDALLQPNASVAPERINDAVRRIADAGAAVVPTLSFVAMTARMLDDVEAVFRDPLFARLAPDVQAMWREQNPARRNNLEAFARRERVKRPAVTSLTRKLQDAGVLLLAGTDASAPGMYPGRSLHLEIEELVASGLTTVDALAAATRNAGRFLAGHPRDGARADLRDLARLGTIEPGAVADLVLLSGNPLEDVGHLSRVDGVMTRGRWRPVRAQQDAPRRQVAVTIDDVPGGGGAGSP
jgi:imidazolonepropionase-like amidohydrolase